MKIIEQSCEWFQRLPADALQIIELAGRVAYKSEDRITDDGAQRFVSMIMQSGHESVIEHVSASMRFITDRGVLAEITGHRISSFSVESSRFCNYSKAKFGSEITVVRPVDLAPEDGAYLTWYLAMRNAETAYFDMLQRGCTPQLARSVLPMALKTEIIMTANLRSWLNVFKLRTANNAHPQMRALMLQAQGLFAQLLPTLLYLIVYRIEWHPLRIV